MFLDEKLQLILEHNFSNREYFLIRPETQNVPLVVANVIKSTRSFSAGQLVYIYDVYWGMNDNAKIVGRFRRKQNWMRGVIPIKNLSNFRLKAAYEPTVLKKLQGEKITRYLFPRFLSLTKGQGEVHSSWKYATKQLVHWLKRVLGY